MNTNHETGCATDGILAVSYAKLKCWLGHQSIVTCIMLANGEHFRYMFFMVTGVTVFVERLSYRMIHVVAVNVLTSEAYEFGGK